MVELSGNVRLRAGTLAIRAQQVRLHLGKSGQVSRLDAGGGVSVTTNGWRGKAARATVLVTDWKIQLTGDAQLSRSKMGMRVEGERIDIDARRGHVGVVRARATLTSPESTHR